LKNKNRGDGLKINFLTKNIFYIHDSDARGFTTGGAVCGSETILFGCDDRLTPGDTAHSVSYIVNDDGMNAAFIGGLLHKGGKIPYLYRLTEGVKGEGHMDYHGYLRGKKAWKPFRARTSPCRTWAGLSKT